jgi:hypothetical protein
MDEQRERVLHGHRGEWRFCIEAEAAGRLDSELAIASGQQAVALIERRGDGSSSNRRGR